jgi:riboflavin synthase
MFTGIIETKEKVHSLQKTDTGATLTLNSPYLAKTVGLGSSVAINGVCLTVEKIEGTVITFRLMLETLRKTAFKDLTEGDEVNIETSLRPNEEMAGHFVYGHVDGVGEVTDMTQDGDAWLWSVKVPEHLEEYLVPQGAIALHGASLTIARLSGSTVTISLVKHTLDVTNLRDLPIGAKINVECDMMLKFAAKSLQSLKK